MIDAAITLSYVIGAIFCLRVYFSIISNKIFAWILSYVLKIELLNSVSAVILHLYLAFHTYIHTYVQFIHTVTQE